MDMTETRKSKRLQLLERGITKEVRMNESVNYLDYANSPLMWAAAALAVAVVVFQSILFMKRSIKAASESALTTDQVHKAIKSSVISSIGPSVVILVTMISLLVTMGAPVAWMRLSFIGSVNYEAMAAGFGAQAMGKTLQTMDTMAFACGVWTMVCGSLGWLIFTFLFCDKMDKVNHLMSKGNAKMVPSIPILITLSSAILISLLFQGYDAFNFYFCCFRKSSNCYTGTSRFGLAKESTVYFIYLGKIVHIGQENGCFHHFRAVSSCCCHDCVQIL